MNLSGKKIKLPWFKDCVTTGAKEFIFLELVT